MRFEIVKNKKVVFWTEDASCIPPEDQIEDMKEEGYTFRKVEENGTD